MVRYVWRYRNGILPYDKKLDYLEIKMPKQYSYIVEDRPTDFERIVKINYKDKSLAVILSSLSTRETIVKLIKRVKFIFKK